MKRILNHVCLAALAVAMFLAPAAGALAQQRGGAAAQPVAVISVASFDALKADAGYLTRAAGVPSLGTFFELSAAAYTTGLDTTKSSGVYVTMEGDQPRAVAFVAVKDLKAALANLEEQIGKPVERDNGVLEIGLDRKAFVKEQEGWAFVSDRAENLTALPMDPSTLLAGLEGKYALAARVNMQNLPAEVRRMAIDELKKGFEQQLETARANSDNPEAVDKLGRGTLDSLVRTIEESDQITLGWAVDSAGRRTFLDVSITAVPGTELARRMALAKDSPTRFAGFRLPDAAVTVSSAAALPKESVEQLVALIGVGRQQAMEGIDNDASLPDDAARTAAKGVVNQLMDLIQSTIEEGKVDFGASLVLEPGSFTFASGTTVADGAEASRLLARVVELAKNEPDFPDVKLNAARHGDVNLHTISIPVPEDDADARRLLGERFEIVLGTAPKSFYVALGKEPMVALKGAIDKSAQASDPLASPLRLELALTPILKFAQSVQDNPALELAVTAIERSGGKDRVAITSEAIENGVRTRIEVEDGILQLVGTVVRILQGPGLEGGNF